VLVYVPFQIEVPLEYDDSDPIRFIFYSMLSRIHLLMFPKKTMIVYMLLPFLCVLCYFKQTKFVTCLLFGLD
jgi:hypothetical protein